MCEFCAEHGEGKVWYLAMRNYGEELLAQGGRREHIVSFLRDFEAGTAGALASLDAIQRLPFLPEAVGRVATARQKRSHFGQVVPVEDAERVLDLVDSVVRLPCACRSLTTGRSEARYCFGLGVDPAGWFDQLPDYAEKLERLDREEARAAIRGLDRDGLVHSVWTFGTPFIGGLCNCDRDCVAYRLQVGTGMMQVFFPAEYVAAVDWDACSGCRQCRARCPFGAVRYAAAAGKCTIDPHLCYGCGVCRAVCHTGAIRLEPRRQPFRWRRGPAGPGGHRLTVGACRDPRGCLACLSACPAGVFGVAPTHRDPGRRAESWRVRVLTPSRCTGCGRCVAVCPEDAIALD